MAERKFIDCSKYPSAQNCTLAIYGKEDEVLDMAIHHAVTKHGHADTPELRQQLRGMIQSER
jgi:hypothetical protein